MRILVSTASRHGSTEEIATRVAEAIRAGLGGDAVVDVRLAADVGDAPSHDALVLGSAVYLGRWLDDARRVAQWFATSPPRPVWIFSSCLVGDPPKPAQELAEAIAIATMTLARGHRIFAGRPDRHRFGFDEKTAGFDEKTAVRAQRVAGGDHHDWHAIDAWGAQIAAELGQRAIAGVRTR